MAKTDINENIYRAIDTIIDARLQNVNFNSTVLCTIVDDSKAASGIFTVDNAGIKFQATSMDKSFKVNDQVYVTVPNNNFDAQKIIISKKEDFAKLQEQWKDPFSYLDIKYKFDDAQMYVALTPTYHETPSPVPTIMGRICLNTLFQDDMYTRQYKTWQEAQADLYNSGWEDVPFNLITESNLSLLAILKRQEAYEDIYRIKQLNLAESSTARVPVGGGIPHYIGRSKFNYDTDKRWKDNSNAQFVFDTEGFLLYQNKEKYQPIPLTGLKNIIVSVDVRTELNFEDTKPGQGDYLIQCKLFLEKIQNNESVKKEFSLVMANNKDFLGDSYNYFDFFTQTVLFDCSDYQDYIVNKIEFIAWQNDNFQYITENSKIYITNPKIYFGTPVQETIIGYKDYSSFFRTNHNYYQKINPTVLRYILVDLRANPPIDTELICDGPFEMDISSTLEPVLVKRYKPKVYIKKNNTYIEHDTVKYYDEIWKNGNFSLNNIYSWNNLEKLWEGYILTTDSTVQTGKTYYTYNSTTETYIEVSNPSGNPLEQGWFELDIEEFYVCFPAGRETSGYMGIVESTANNEEIPPRIGISSNDSNTDVTLSTSANNSNIIIEATNYRSQIQINGASNRNITINENNDIVLNNNNKTSIDLNEDGIVIKYKKDSKNEMDFRLGYNDNYPAINLAVKAGGSWGQVHLTASKLNYLATLLEGH